jgi:hypothetical protein
MQSQVKPEVHLFTRVDWEEIAAIGTGMDIRLGDGSEVTLEEAASITAEEWAVVYADTVEKREIVALGLHDQERHEIRKLGSVTYDWENHLLQLIDKMGENGQKAFAYYTSQQ